jgi:uncharacterized SAM-binding protein YcdF (DUF218 family)
MYIYLSKILPLLVLPVGIVFELLVIALLFLWWKKRKPAMFLIVAAMAVLWFSSMPIVANTVLGKLEQRIPAVPLSAVPESKCVVVLGGALEPLRPPRVDVNLLDSIDRISKTASLYRAGKARLVIVSGGNQPWAPKLKSEAAAIRTVLVEWGVANDDIIVDETSRNTYENAFNSMLLLREAKCGVPLLVTSAAHMPRAVASFERMSVDVFPVSADVRAVRPMRLTVMDFVPDMRSLDMTTNAMRELVGKKIYEFRGWN